VHQTNIITAISKRPFITLRRLETHTRNTIVAAESPARAGPRKISRSTGRACKFRPMQGSILVLIKEQT
jgi:hypothetical protein